MFSPDPIQRIEVQSNGFVTVTMTTDGIAGSRAKVRRSGSTWKLIEAGEWVS